MSKVLEKIYLQVLKSILQYKYLYYIIFIIIFFVSICRISVDSKSVYNGGESEFRLKILNITYRDNNDIILFQGNEKLIGYIKDFPYNVGDIVKIKGKLIKPKNNTIPNAFNYHKYLQSRKINWELKTSDISLVKKNSNIFYKIKNLVNNRIRRIPNNEYLYAYILGDTSYIERDIREKYQDVGLSYLLSLGSFQIMMITFVLDKIRISVKKKIILKTIVIIIYILFTNYAIGVLRSGMCFIFSSVLKYKKIHFKYSNIILVVGIILLIINPFYVNNIGFLYSFSISLAISILHKRITGNYYQKLFFISLIAFIVSLPINIYVNYKVNFLSIIFSIIMIPLYHFIVFPFSILVFIFPSLSFIYDLVILFINNIINVLSSFTILLLVFRKPTILIILIYYLVIIAFFYNKKYLVLFIILLFVHHNINSIISENLVTFLDVNQGDSILLKNNNKITLIDTGGGYISNYSDDIIKYINSLGLSKIENLIISHGESDHMGSSIPLVNNIKIEKVIFNCGEYSNLEEELISILNKKKIMYYSCIKELNIDKNKLYFLQTREYDNENDNSNVIYTELNGYKFMFMGDASITTEKEIIDKYNIPKIDVLKVGHHGSKTSSGKEFINEINPKISIISVGKKNRYGHPNKEVLDNLYNSKVYRTDEDGSIMFKIKNNKLKIDTCSP